MLKVCKYSGMKPYEVRFLSDWNEIRKSYNLAIFENGFFNRAEMFDHSNNQVIFSANEKIMFLGNCEKYLILRDGISLEFLWTSFKGKPEIIEMRGGKKQLFDYLFMTFAKKLQKILYVGNSYEAPLAGWRNENYVDVLCTNGNEMLDLFLRNTVETFLPFG